MSILRNAHVAVSNLMVKGPIHMALSKGIGCTLYFRGRYDGVGEGVWDL